jgi:hypothetical protein
MAPPTVPPQESHPANSDSQSRSSPEPHAGQVMRPDPEVVRDESFIAT